MDAQYTFVVANDKKYKSFESSELQDMLMKWSMKGRLKIQTYLFNEPFHSYSKTQFIQEFFKDEVVAYTLQNVNDCNEWTPIGTTADSVEIEDIPCTITSMSFFDRIQGSGQITSKNGSIVKCLGEQMGEFEVWDHLRRMLLDEESENADLFSENEKNEFIFRLFKHLCLGGRWCQYEDTLAPYLTATRLLYKDLISVAKDPETNNLTTTSVVFKVQAKNKNGEVYLPEDPDHLQNFCYLIINPLKQVVAFVIHQFGCSF